MLVIFLHIVETLWPEELIFYLFRDRIYILFYKLIKHFFCANMCSKKYDVTSTAKRNFSAKSCACTVLTINEYIQNLLNN